LGKKKKNPLSKKMGRGGGRNVQIRNVGKEGGVVVKRRKS